MRTLAHAAWVGLLPVPSLALGGQPASQPGSGPGPGPRAGAGHWGRGAMMGSGQGPGMMAGMDGMMGGYGMMAGCGGMMGPGWSALDLSKDQRNRIHAIHRELREKQFALMDRMHDSMESAGVYRNGRFDEQAARTAHAAAEKTRGQMFENVLNAQKQIDGLLTAQQRQQLSRAGE